MSVETDQLRATGSPVARSATPTARTTDLLHPQEQHSKFWQNAHYYFDRVYQTMGLVPVGREYLSSPKRVMTGACPGEKSKLHKGESYVVSDNLSSHRSYSENGVKLLIVDGDFLK